MQCCTMRHQETLNSLGDKITFQYMIQGKAKKVVIVGGGYIGMEVAAAAVAWNLDTTVIIPLT